MREGSHDQAALAIIASASAMLSSQDAECASVAAKFCAMSDDAQAQFFVHVARLMGEWGAAPADIQRHYIGRHLRDCECSTEPAREWLRSVVRFMDEEKHDAD